MVVARGCREGRNSELFNGYKVLALQDENSSEDELHNYTNVLNTIEAHTLKMGQMVNFMSRIFYYN